MAQQMLANIVIRLQPMFEAVTWVYEDEKFQQLPAPPDSIDLGAFPSEEDWDELCKQFVSLDMNSRDEILEFLNHTGEWERGATSLWPANLQQEQAEIAAIMLEKKWGSTRLQSVLDDLESPPYGPPDEPPERERPPIYIDRIHVPGGRRPGGLEIGVYDTRSALYLTLWLQRVQGAKFRYCKRSDCPDHSVGKTPFPVTRPDKIYCSQYCAHLESLRKKRAEQSAQRRTHHKKGK